MYFDANNIKHVKLSEQRKSELSQIMSDALLHMKRASHRLYGDLDIRRLRSEWRSGLISLRDDQQSREALQSLEQIEHEVIAGYIRIAYAFCKKFYDSHRQFIVGLNFEDLIQESSIAIFNSMYGYDGRGAFSTYCSSSIEKKLVDYIRNYRTFSKLSPRISKWRNSVVELMNNKNLKFDEALEEYNKKRIEDGMKKLSDDQMWKIKDAHKVSSVKRIHYNKEYDLVLTCYDKTDETSMELSLMKEVIKSDSLNEDDREFVQRFIDSNGAHGWLTEIACERGVSRARTQQKWKSIRNKLKKALDIRRRAA